MVRNESLVGKRRIFVLIYVNAMARTPSNMLALGTTAPDFDLPDTRTQQFYEWKDIQGSQGTLIVFICNHCPFVIHLIEPLVALSNDYLKKGIGIAFISSNDVLHYPQDGPEEMQKFADKYGMEFPYLYDESQQTAIDYQAACTPDFYLFNDQKELVYRGQFDDSRPGNAIAVSGQSLREAMDQLLQGNPPITEQRPSLGCNIKWKSENIPPDHY